MLEDGDIEELWQQYREEERHGDRAAALRALERFVARVEGAAQHLREPWVDRCLLELRSSGSAIRAPLFQRVLFPELRRRDLAGDAAAAQTLAELSQELFRFRAGWQLLGSPSETDLWKTAYLRSPTSAVARAKLVAAISAFIHHTLHELPAGVLYGTNGATLEQCVQLQGELAFFRGLLTAKEAEQFRELLTTASYHYATYREYLSSPRAGDYAAYLHERG